MVTDNVVPVRVGIDVGSTTVKVVVLDDSDNILYGEYERHRADIRSTIIAVVSRALDAIEEKCPAGKEQTISVKVTGSGGLSVSQWLEIPFIQEVVAATTAVQKIIPRTDVVIELGGEDAKITYFKGGVEQRMNGTCAGGTGAFIDQMAALLETDASGLNKLAAGAATIYPIAARCGVFAKTDIQPLINEGARREDIAASIFQAVVSQTISGLACGKPIRGNVAFLGGPLHFLDQLRQRFITTLKLPDDAVIVPENSQLFVAAGAAYSAERAYTCSAGCGCSPEASQQNEVSRQGAGASSAAGSPQASQQDEAARQTAVSQDEALSGGGLFRTVAQFRESLKNLVDAEMTEVQRLEPLFRSEDELLEFQNRHAAEKAKAGDLSKAAGPVFLGLDAGSTTTKAVLIDTEGSI